ncbi:MAG: polymer-forming cytoskeletal protein [Verrucomicrobia bacterium]|nr:polymer-forming cytoskeletal protein [Verrucomicrobiota bacterium]
MSPSRTVETRRVTCFDCGTEMEVPVSAKSSMCKRCSSHLDFQDYTVNQAVSKSFRTKGGLRVEKSGYIFNTEILAGEVTVHGRIQGKVTAERRVTVHTGADLRGPVRTPLLVIPEGQCFFWREGLQAEAVEVAGELVGEPRLLHTLRLFATGRLFGGAQTRHLIVESGAILVGRLEVSA